MLTIVHSIFGVFSDKSRFFLLIRFCFISLILLNACGDGAKAPYKASDGEPDLSLLTGSWKGHVKSLNSRGDVSYTSKTWFNGVLEMNGERAGESDVFLFNPLDSNGNIESEGWVNKIRIFQGNVSYLTDDYGVSNWSKIDSNSFRWFLLGESFNNEEGKAYRNYVIFKRKMDSLFIIDGRMMIEDSAFNIDTYYCYKKL